MRPRLRIASVTIALLVVFFFAMSGAEKAPEAATQISKVAVPFSAPPYKEGELLVKFREGVPGTASAQARSMVGATLSKDLRNGMELVKLPAGMSISEGISLFKSNPEVLSVSPNYTRTANQTTPNDTSFSFLWGMNNTGQTGGTIDADIDAPEAWDFTTGSSNIIIAVVDSGVDYTHPDLLPNMWQNPLEIPANGIDDDGNGYIDDIFGIDTVNGDSDPIDDFGHGTHVAGTIGAVGNNGIGVAGVNWDVQIMALKFLNATGVGSVADEIEALNYLADMADRLQAAGRPERIVAANASFGGFFPLFTFEPTAIDNLRERGILFVTAAGNAAADNDALLHFPSSYDLPNIIAVAATNHSDQLASFSNFGRRTVHIGAPGVSIISTLPGGGYGDFDIGWSGTSMATPHVAGTVGLLYSMIPGLDPRTAWPIARNQILAGGDLNQFMDGRTVTGRRLNAFGAIACSDSELLTRIRPSTSEFFSWLDPVDFEIWYTTIPGKNDLTAIIGIDSFDVPFSVPVKLSALHINCANPAGDVPVIVAGENITLLDDGNPPFDLVAGDGVYSGQWNPPLVEGDFLAGFPTTGVSFNPFNDTFTVRVRRTDDPRGFVVADAGWNFTVRDDSEGFSLDGSASGSRLDIFSPLIYLWMQTGGEEVPLLDAETPFPMIEAVPPVPEDEEQLYLIFELLVSDLDGNFDTDTMGPTAHKTCWC